MRKQVVALLLGALSLSACGSASGNITAPPLAAEPVVTSTTTVVPSTTTTTATLPSTTHVPETTKTTMPSATTTTQPMIEIGTPVLISINSPSVNIQAEVYPHGPEQGDIFSPAKGKVGWWTGNRYVAPGEQGLALLAGHVTDVFADLVPQDKDKNPLPVEFDELEVLDESGRTFVFVVQDQFREYKGQIQWDEIYRVYPERVLWLFTCGGTDEDGDGHREWNDIVRVTLDRIIESDGTVVNHP